MFLRHRVHQVSARQCVVGWHICAVSPIAVASRGRKAHSCRHRQKCVPNQDMNRVSSWTERWSPFSYFSHESRKSKTKRTRDFTLFKEKKYPWRSCNVRAVPGGKVALTEKQLFNAAVNTSGKSSQLSNFGLSIGKVSPYRIPTCG